MSQVNRTSQFDPSPNTYYYLGKIILWQFLGISLIEVISFLCIATDIISTKKAITAN
jgi:hypothetical protein